MGLDAIQGDLAALGLQHRPFSRGDRGQGPASIVTGPMPLTERLLQRVLL